jgi:hypothetical protein
MGKNPSFILLPPLFSCFVPFWFAWPPCDEPPQKSTPKKGTARRPTGELRERLDQGAREPFGDLPGRIQLGVEDGHLDPYGQSGAQEPPQEFDEL